MLACLIGAILFAMVGFGLSQALQSTRAAKCSANLRQINQAIMMYAEENQTFPILSNNQTLSQLLVPWTGTNSSLFSCPQDSSGSSDSYSYYYAPRSMDDDWTEYLIGCSRHQKFTRGVAIFNDNHISQSANAPIFHDGQTIMPGDEYDRGVWTFADGSQAFISNGNSGSHGNEENNHSNSDDSNPNGSAPVLSALFSYEIGKGVYYTVVKMKEGRHGTINFSVIPGNQFEVVTPAGVIAVRGTQFSVTTQTSNGNEATQVILSSGIVDLTPVGKGPPIRLTPNPGNNRGFVVKGSPPIHN